MAQLMLSNIEVKPDILSDPKYKFLFSVEEVNKLVLSGIPFRDAYKTIGKQIESGNYNPGTTVNHTHEGSIGNLCLPDIAASMQKVISSFQFEKYKQAIEALLK